MFAMLCRGRARSPSLTPRQQRGQGMTQVSSGKLTRVGRVAVSQKSRSIMIAFAATVALTLTGVGDGGAKRGVQGASAQTLERPNIVFVLTDDQFPGTENKM